MTSAECREIIGDRFGGWAAKLQGEHATPVFALGAGHDQQSGQLVLCTVENLSPLQLVQLLRFAAAKLEAQELGLSATGEYPDGKVDQDDQGEIKTSLCPDPAAGRVRMNFGKSISWLSMTPREARAWAEKLRQASYKAEGKGG